MAANAKPVRELKYIFSDGATGEYPGTWGYREWRLYSDDTIERNRRGHYFDNDASEWVQIGDSKIFVIGPERTKELSELLDTVINKLKDIDPYSIARILDGGEYSVASYSNGQRISHYNSQDYGIDPALKTLLNMLHSIDGDNLSQKYLKQRKSLGK